MCHQNAAKSCVSVFKSQSKKGLHHAAEHGLDIEGNSLGEAGAKGAERSGDPSAKSATHSKVIESKQGNVDEMSAFLLGLSRKTCLKRH